MDQADREQRIRQRAHEIWERTGRAEGSHEEHWHTAEREIAAEAVAAQPPSGAQEKPATKPRAVKKAPAASSTDAAPRSAAPRRRPAAGASPLN